MKKIIIAAGVAGLVYYFFFYNKSAAPAAPVSTATGTLNNPKTATTLGRLNLNGSAFSTAVPGVASIS